MKTNKQYIKEFREKWRNYQNNKGFDNDNDEDDDEIFVEMFIKKVLKSQKKGKVVWLEVTDYAEALRVCGEYSKKEPKNPIYKYKKFRINLIKEDE